MRTQIIIEKAHSQTPLIFSRLPTLLVGLILSIVMISSGAIAQEYVYQRTGALGSTGADAVSGITEDPSGSMYVAGWFSGTADLDTTTSSDLHTPVGTTDGYLSKYSIDGTYLWSITLGGSGVTYVDKIVSDNNGNVYVGGRFSNTLDFDPSGAVDSRTSQGNIDVFLMRINADGSYGWTKTFGGTASEAFADLVIDRLANKIYMVGVYSGTLDFDPGVGIENHTSLGSNDLWIAKYQSDGSYLSTLTIGGSGEESLGGAAVDGLGNVYITGYFRSANMDFDPTAGTDLRTALSGGWDIYLTRLNADDSYGWTQQIGGTGWDWGIGVAASTDGTVVYLGGGYNGTVDFNPQSGTDSRTASGSLSDLFVSKYLADGTYQWTLAGSSTGDDWTRYLAVDANNDVFFLSEIVSTVDFDRGTGVVSVTTSGGFDVVLTKYNANGTHAWSKRIGGSLADTASDLYVGGNKRVYVGGKFQGTVDFDTGTGTNNITSAGGEDAFFSIYDGEVLYPDSLCPTAEYVSVPQTETFEGEELCSTSPAGACVLKGQWSNEGNDDLDWTSYSGVTPSRAAGTLTGPSLDAAPGTTSGKYLYIESDLPAYPNKKAFLLSPAFDLSSSTSAAFYYHVYRYGTNIGTIDVDVSLDDCATWTTLDTITGQLQTSSDQAWTMKAIALSSVVGMPNVRIRVRGETQNGAAGDVAIDNLKVLDNHDVGIVSIDMNANNVVGMAPANVVVSLVNFGATTESNFNISYSVDGQPEVRELFTGSIAPGNTAQYTFVSPANLGSEGPHTIIVQTELVDDDIIVNNTMSKEVETYRALTLPYFNDFEVQHDYWSSGGTRSSWAFGVVAKTVITRAASGTHA